MDRPLVQRDERVGQIGPRKSAAGKCAGTDRPDHECASKRSYLVAGHWGFAAAGLFEDTLGLADVGAAGSLAEVVLCA